jgi:hypothetical protein
MQVASIFRQPQLLKLLGSPLLKSAMFENYGQVKSHHPMVVGLKQNESVNSYQSGHYQRKNGKTQ